MVKSQKGSISIFVMTSMLFFLFVITGVYTISSKKSQAQTEIVNNIKSKYYNEDAYEIYNSKIASTDATIPVHTKEQLLSIGKENEKFLIEGVVYDFSSQNYNKYSLMNNIIFEIDDNKTELDSLLDTILNFEDQIQKNGYSILFFYENDYFTSFEISEKVKENTLLQ